MSYFVKSKKDTKCKNFVNLLCFYVNTFILLYFLRLQEGGGATAPLAPPPNPPLPVTTQTRKKSATVQRSSSLKCSSPRRYVMSATLESEMLPQARRNRNERSSLMNELSPFLKRQELLLIL